MTHPIENCPKYTAEQVEAMAADLRDAPGTSMLGTHISISTGKAVAMYEALIAYAATLRQQAERGDGVVSEEVEQIAWRAFRRSAGEMLDGSCFADKGDIRAALEAVAPLLRAPAEQGGRVDYGLVSELLAEANRQANETADLLNRAAEALAQNAQGEAVALPISRDDIREMVIRLRNEDSTDDLCVEAADMLATILRADRARVPPEVAAWVDAKREHKRLVGVYNDRLAYAKQNDLGSVGVDHEYQAMCAQQRVMNALLEPMFAALAAASSQPEDASHD